MSIEEVILKKSRSRSLVEVDVRIEVARVGGRVPYPDIVAVQIGVTLHGNKLCATYSNNGVTKQSLMITEIAFGK